MEQRLEIADGKAPPSPAAVISREVVRCLKEATGRGPTSSRTYFHDDCVIVLMREGHTRGEMTLGQAGEQRAVAQGRVDISETIRTHLIGVVEQTLGRNVVGFMSSSQQDPDLISFIFVFESAPVIHRGDGSPPADLEAG